MALSLCYFAFNALMTRGCAEMEWNSYALSYKPLRVSHPHGQQTSTYRLQLPYVYGVPVMAFSMLLHWLLSNAVYVSIIDGGMFLLPFGNPCAPNTAQEPPGTDHDADYLTEGKRFNLPGISDRAYVNLGYSSFTVLVVFLVAIVAATLPLTFGMRMKGSMVLCRGSSAVISASCHASTLNVGKQPSKEDSSIEMEPLMSGSAVQADDEPAEIVAEHAAAAADSSTAELITPAASAHNGMPASQALLQVSRSKVRWGVVRMPPEWYAQFGGAEPGVEHLTFGTKAQDVKDPQAGRYYI